MDIKDKIIEEMAKDLEYRTSVVEYRCEKDCHKCNYAGFKDAKCPSYVLAKTFYNAGYRKLPENSVVLSREEYERLKNENKTLLDSAKMMVGCFCDQQTLKDQASKETAEKIYDRHSTLTDFLLHLGVDKDTASADACRIEHVISDTAFAAVKEFIKKQENKKDGKLILVTATSPTPYGEGKTTVSIGLTDALRKIGKDALAVLREPSMGPVFGIKGGATGGG